MLTDTQINNQTRHLFVNSTPPPFQPIPGHGLPLRFFAITLTCTTLDRTPLNEWSARHRDLYLTTQNTHKRKNPCPRRDFFFEPTIPASERPQTHALDRAAIGISWMSKCLNLFSTSASTKLHYIYFSRTRPTYRLYCEKHIPTKGCP